MVNLEVFQYPVTSRPTNLVFKSGSHKRIFAILLADFLAQPRRAALPFAFAPSGQAARETDRTYLFYLEAICRQPQLNIGRRDDVIQLPHVDLPPVQSEPWRSPNQPSRTIGEFLDQIRRALFDYLSPEYARAWRSGDRFDGDYSFDVPSEIRDHLAFGMYWELMNRVRGGLWFPAFSVSPLLKNHF
jgi:hypothetical protein